MNPKAGPAGRGTLIVIACNAGPSSLSVLADAVDAHERIVLCDPLCTPETALSGMDRRSDVLHLDAIPSRAGATAELRVFSLPGLVGLTEPLNTLHALFPGLRERGRKTIDLLDPDAFAAHLADLPQPFTCAMFLPGAETDILDALEAAGLMERISRLHLRCGVEPFFAGASDRAAIEARMVAAGCALASVRTDDPDWPELHFFTDPRYRENEQLGTAMKSLEGEREAQRAEMSETRALLSAREDDIARMKSEIARLNARLAEQEGALETSRAEAARCGERAQAQESGRVAAEAALEAARLECERARLDAPSQIRLNATLQLDIDDLRARLEASETARRAQEDLLRKITPKLAQAADQLRQLQTVSGHPEPRIPETAAPREVTANGKTDAGRERARAGQDG